MNLSKIHHIAIIVSDYEAAKDFYVNKLGFSVIRENYRLERRDWKLDLRVNEHTELEIFAEENPPKRVNRPEACGLRHLAFCVDNVEQTVKELAEVGIECEPIRVDDYTDKRFGSRFAFTGQFLPPGRTLHRKCGGWQCLCRNHRAAHYCQQASDPLFHFRIPSVLNFRNL